MIYREIDIAIFGTKKKLLEEENTDDNSVKFRDFLAGYTGTVENKDDVSNEQKNETSSLQDLYDIAINSLQKPTYNYTYTPYNRSTFDYDKFSYDPNTDASYLSYARLYTRNGENAYRDTLGKLAANNNGVGSSYAAAMSLAAYNNYMAQLADKVPELLHVARSMYDTDRNFAYNLWDTTESAKEAQWDAYQNSLATAAKYRYLQEADDYNTKVNNINDWYTLQKEQEETNKANYENASAEAAKYTNPYKMYQYLEGLTDEGTITAEQAVNIINDLGYKPTDFVNSSNFNNNNSTSSYYTIQSELQNMNKNQRASYIENARSKGQITEQLAIQLSKLYL